MKVKFTPTEVMRIYRGPLLEAKEPGVYEVGESEAKRLCADFPENFSAVEAGLGGQKSEHEPTSNRAKGPTRTR